MDNLEEAHTAEKMLGQDERDELEIAMDLEEPVEPGTPTGLVDFEPASRPETPNHEQEDDLLNHDEPSSVLASRILSAPHNQSPPPSALGSRRRSLSRRPSNLGLQVESASAYRMPSSPGPLLSPAHDMGFSLPAGNPLDAPLLVSHPDPEAPSTPPTPRRSTRPRRSVTPFESAESGKNKTPSPAPRKAKSRTPSPGPSTRRSRRSKSGSRSRSRSRSRSPDKEGQVLRYSSDAPPVPPLDPRYLAANDGSTRLSSPSPAPIAQTPQRASHRRSRSRSPEKDVSAEQMFKRELGSLSPASTLTLGQLGKLLPTMRQSPSRDFVPLDLTSLATPARMESPTRMLAAPGRQASPAKPPTLTADGDQSPRRIPVKDAVAKGYISPWRGSQLLSTQTSPESSSLKNSTTRPLNVRPEDSPTRVLVSHPPSSRPLLSSSTASPFKAMKRSGSVEPKPVTRTTILKKRQTSAEPQITARKLSAPSPTLASIHSTLPFPLVPNPHIPQSIPEEAPQQRTDASTSRAKSGSSVPKSILKQPTSRIPRPNNKPYARPAGSTGVHSSQSPTKSSLKRGESHLSQRLSTQSQNKPASSSTGGRKDRLEVKPPSTQSTSSPLKRKREDNTQPIEHRKVPIVLLPAPMHNSPLKSSQSSSSPVKAERPRVSPPSEKLTSASSPSVVPPSGPELQESTTLSAQDLPSVKDQEETIQSAGPRRTGRLRKQVQPVYTLESHVSTAPRSQPSRRKPMSQTSSQVNSDPFARMTAVALRSLTSDNTLKNQFYQAAKLETEVVRREGDRPSSPGMKVKSVVQKEEEEKQLRRQERADRRARRGDEDSLDSIDTEPSARSPTPLPPTKHRRGAGEDEDYETPVRPPPMGKRRRVGDSVQEAESMEKRVTWDHGLFTTAILDDVKPGTKARTKEPSVTKGCFALAVKDMRLDTLGNLCTSNSHLPDLIEEKVIVKKFVYENDEPELVEPVVPATKNTRSKSKKNKM